MARKKKDADAGPTAEAPPKKAGRFKQIWQIYRAAAATDPLITWWMLGVGLAVVALVTLIGLLLGHWTYFLIISIPMALLGALVVMGRRAERAAYKQVEGQPGASGAALSSLRRGWYYEKEPVAAEGSRPGDMKGIALVFRAIGRPGVVLVGEGPPARATRLVEAERKRVNRVAPNVPVHILRIGHGENEVPVQKLSKKIGRMRPELSKAEVEAVNKRLKALGGVKMPIPKGTDPTRARPDRRAMRGR
jgi:hypothetical protein